MTRAIEERDFQLAYREAVETVASDVELCFRLPASSDRLTMLGYLTACEALYVEALGMLRERGEEAWPARVLDAGGSFGAFASALRSLGVAVVHDAAAADPVDLVIGLALHARADPAWTIATVGGRLLGPNGRLVLVVPSSAHWPCRLASLRGRAPSAHDDEAAVLGTPSYGTRRLRALLLRSGLRTDRLRARDYSPLSLGGPLRQTVAGAVMRVAPQHREVWLALASRDRRA